MMQSLTLRILGSLFLLLLLVFGYGPEAKTSNPHFEYGQSASMDGGIVLTTVGDSDSRIWAMQMQTDGKVLAAGEAYTGLLDCIGLVRYKNNGSLDTSFNTTGKVMTALGTGHTNFAVAVAVQPNEKILVVGHAVALGHQNSDATIVRYNTNGSLDTSFRTSGKLTTSISTGDDYASAVLLQTDGKIITWGYGVRENSDLAIARYLTDGSFDTSFQTTGRLLISVSTGNDYAGYAGSLLLQSDGKIYGGGYGVGSNSDFILVRFHTDGSLDTSFSTRGTLVTSISTGNDYMGGLVFQPDGKIYSGGYGIGENPDFAIARFHTDGTLDTSFRTSGKLMTSIGTYYDFVDAIVISPNGKLLAVGAGWHDTGNLALARYLTSGNLDTSFVTVGHFMTSLRVNGASARAIALDSTGAYIVAGEAYATGIPMRFAITRVLP